jgi:hypothetical protein
MKAPLAAFNGLLARGVLVCFSSSFLPESGALADTPVAKSQPIPYTTSWLGNSHGRGDGKWVQNNILGLHASPDGTVYTNSW